MIEKQKYAHAKTYRVSSYRECLSTCETIRKRSNAYAILEFEKPLEIEGRTSFPYSNFYLKGNGSKFVSNSAGKYTDKDNRELTTWRTATFSSYGDNCIFEDFIFENRACLPKKNGQAVALSCFSNNCLFINCKIVSSQDTLFIGPLPDDLIFRYTDFIPEREKTISAFIFTSAISLLEPYFNKESIWLGLGETLENAFLIPANTESTFLPKVLSTGNLHRDN